MIVSGEERRDSAINIHVSVLPKTPPYHDGYSTGTMYCMSIELWLVLKQCHDVQVDFKSGMVQSHFPRGSAIKNPPAMQAAT